ncbi:MAG: hypothetical protein K6T39_01855 [Anoxybacillus ayderensis]|jgi:hypothetical protein|nr:hypothetical protein [Anoxybacillus ayderensis]
MKVCVNCGDEFNNGEGYPIDEEAKWECCCSLSCWLEFTDQAPWINE